MTAPQRGPRRRAGNARRSGTGRSGVLAGGVVALAVVAVLLTAPGGPAAEPAPATSGELVTHRTLSCPDLPASRGTATRFLVGAAPANGVGDHGSLRRSARGEQPTTQHLARGQLVRLPASARPPVLEADGQLAAGLFGFRADSDPAAGTLAVAPCDAPRATWWFTGAGATLDHTSRLVMTNVDQGPAVVDVRVLGADGEVDTVGTRGITIGPGTRVVLPLTDVAPQGEELSVSVRASRGRVVAAVSDAFAPSAGAGQGQEWLPAQAVPSRVVRLAGLAARANRRTLLVANPSPLEALVDVRVAGRSGAFEPVGLGQIRVAPGTVEATDVTRTVGSGPLALRLRSQVAVVASLRSTGGGDSSYAAPVLPLAEPAVAPVPARTKATVLLTAGELPARATVTGYAADGRTVETRQLQLGPTATTAWTPGRRVDYLVVRVDRGSVHGAVGITGPGQTQVALQPLTVRLRRPSVRPAAD